jgi:hypothetical protein
VTAPPHSHTARQQRLLHPCRACPLVCRACLRPRHSSCSRAPFAPSVRAPRCCLSLASFTAPRRPYVSCSPGRARCMPLTASPAVLAPLHSARQVADTAPSQHSSPSDVVASELLRSPPAHTSRRGTSPLACRPHPRRCRGRCCHNRIQSQRTASCKPSRLTEKRHTWTATAQTHKPRDSGTNSKSRSRIDGCQSPMVRTLSLALCCPVICALFRSRLHVDGSLPVGGPGCLHTLQSRARAVAASIRCAL